MACARGGLILDLSMINALRRRIYDSSDSSLNDLSASLCTGFTIACRFKTRCFALCV